MTTKSVTTATTSVGDFSLSAARQICALLIEAGVPAEVWDTHSYGAPDDDEHNEWSMPGDWFRVRYPRAYKTAVQAGGKVDAGVVARVRDYLTAHPVC